ncbi:MAG: hypothetical protein L6Q54_01190 [Leptospiraceae bacterium]|nr:hypothetical protein [Leptospiraceae bacterium]MCK6379854.1 hypothetical protein [Leptospiraceae bacterium]NUM42509.1 hypothetical protein [Leptospiraceae bacterium]
MSDSSKKVLEKNAHGEYVFTPYGEFLSYYHAHVQIFSQLIERKKLPKAESDSLSQRIKSFMLSNIKKSDHFFENIKNFAGFLEMNQANLQEYLNNNFLEILNKVQAKLKSQEIEKLSTEQGNKKNFNSILEELNSLFGEKLLKNIQFVKEEGRVVLVDLTTGNRIESQSYSAEESSSEKITTKKEVEVIVREPEKSILKEIIELYGNELQGIKLEAQNPNNFISTADIPLPTKADKKQEKEELEIIEDLQFEDGSTQSLPENSANEVVDLDFLLSQVPEKIKDPIDDFLFKEYSNLLKIIQSYQAAKDTEGYNHWLSQSSEIERSFVSIRNYTARELKGESVNWGNVFRNISDKTNLTEDSLNNLKRRIEIFKQTKIIQDECIMEFKQLPPQILNLVKSAWPHILNSFERMPKVDEVEDGFQNILSRIKNENENKAISQVLQKITKKLQSLVE